MGDQVTTGNGDGDDDDAQLKLIFFILTIFYIYFHKLTSGIVSIYPKLSHFYDIWAINGSLRGDG